MARSPEFGFTPVSEVDKADFLARAKDREPLQDHCGIVAIYSPTGGRHLYMGLAGLIKLQTRGYEGAGYYCMDKNGVVTHFVGSGMIDAVFHREVVNRLKEVEASTVLLQTRYGTNGATAEHNLQPIFRTDMYGQSFAIVHNGQFSDENGHAGDTVIESDTVFFAGQLASSSIEDWDNRVVELHMKKKGAWCVAISTSDGIYLSRDPHGIRPFWYGFKQHPQTGELTWAAASETSALEAMGVTQLQEVPPGCVIKISQEGEQLLYQEDPEGQEAACIFEDIYIEDGSSAAHLPYSAGNYELSGESHRLTVEKFREKTGEILAREAPVSADFVVGVPGTGIAGGKSFAKALGLSYLQFISDVSPQDDHRTFMSADITEIAQKLNSHYHFKNNYLEGASVVLVDDSLVRGNVTKNLVKQLLTPVADGGYGVKEVHIRILCPPIVRGCYLGINTRNKSELLAAQYIEESQEGDPKLVQAMIEQMQHEIGAASLAFLSHDGMAETVGGDTTGFCLGCFVGHQPPIDRNGRSQSVQVFG